MRAPGSSRWVALLCFLGALLALALALLVPAGQPYDEPAHYDNVAYYAEHHRMPVLGEVGVHYEAQMGPVYYAVGALALQVAGQGEDPRSGLMLLRLLGVVLLPALGWLTHRLARDLGAAPPAAVIATGLVVLNPTVLAMAASVQNDLLCLVLSAAAALLALRALRQGGWRLALGAGLLIGLAVLVKVFAGALLIGYILAVLIARESPLRHRILQAGAAAGGTLAISGWWFVRNLVLYGDLTGAGAVGRTGVYFPPLRLDGVGSVAAWGQSLISYAFAPTEYYRNAFDAPLVAKVMAVVTTVLIVSHVLAQVRGRAGRSSAVRREPRLVFAVSSTVVVVLTYVVAAWTMQAIAPRLVFVVAPLAVSLLARGSSAGTGRRILALALVAFLCLDIWLVTQVVGLDAEPGLFPL